MQGEDGHDSTEHLCAIRCTQIRQMCTQMHSDVHSDALRCALRCTQIRQMCTQMHSDALRNGHDSTEHRDVVDAF